MIVAFGAFCAQTLTMRLQSSRHRPRPLHRHCRRAAADVVGAGQYHDHLRLDAVQFAVREAPEDVLRRVGAPPKLAAFQP